MPALPTFNCYTALELNEKASSSDITASYRRLALIHHPDKNPEDPNATARFQEINTAYATLKDPASRQKYDSRNSSSATMPSSGFPSSRRSYWDSDDEYEYGYDDEDDLEEEEFQDFLRARFAGARGGGFNFGSGGPGGFPFEFFSRERTDAEFEAMEREREAEWARNETFRKQARAEKRAREEEAERKRQVKKAAKQAEEEQKLQSREAKEKEERRLQEQLWADLGVTTHAEKQSTCLHAEFWSKEQQRKKFKCGECGQKRGMIAFKCHLCSLMICQSGMPQETNMQLVSAEATAAREDGHWEVQSCNQPSKQKDTAWDILRVDSHQSHQCPTSRFLKKHIRKRLYSGRDTRAGQRNSSPAVWCSGVKGTDFVQRGACGRGETFPDPLGSRDGAGERIRLVKALCNFLTRFGNIWRAIPMITHEIALDGLNLLLYQLVILDMGHIRKSVKFNAQLLEIITSIRTELLHIFEVRLWSRGWDAEVGLQVGLQVSHFRRDGQRELAPKYNLEVIPPTHSSYSRNNYQVITLGSIKNNNTTSKTYNSQY
ncbi:hypothetical protein G7Y89_g11995 [Cudoniella acicularis]|uniref:J domain-containing protein n=1 Tax=Cudoniella acicularis TaxID=354080 RepID=A0A8H4RCP0_9HELO|nr:hypothetical protein G7Y89_g11995 [Cudoniella acicularis]